MPGRLAKGEITAKVEFKLPSGLKAKAVLMASKVGDGDLSGWLRELVRREWEKWTENQKPEKGGVKFLP